MFARILRRSPLALAAPALAPTTSRAVARAAAAATSGSAPLPTGATAMSDGSILYRHHPRRYEADNLPAAVRTAAARQPRVALTEEEKETIRSLRATDPETWSQRALAARFNCSRLLIAMVAPRPTATSEATAVPVQRRNRRSLRAQAADLRRQRIRDAVADPSLQGL